MRYSVPALLFVLVAAPAWSQPAADLAPVQEPVSPTNPESPANPRRPVWAVFKDVGRLEQPGQCDAHQASTPNARLNRTSPSRVSLMSDNPLRTISVRSMPRPNAKPL